MFTRAVTSPPRGDGVLLRTRVQVHACECVTCAARVYQLSMFDYAMPYDPQVHGIVVEHMFGQAHLERTKQLAWRAQNRDAGTVVRAPSVNTTSPELRVVSVCILCISF